MSPSVLLAVAVRLIGLYVAIVAIGHFRFADGAVSVALTGRDAYLILAALGALGAILGMVAAVGLWLRRRWGGLAALGWMAASIARDLAFVLATSPDDPLGLLLFVPRWLCFVAAGVIALRFAVPRAPRAPVTRELAPA